MHHCALILALLAADPEASKADQSQSMKLLQVFRDEFIQITPGTGHFPAAYNMGSSTNGESATPIHKVRLNSPFHIAKYEVPQNLWEVVMGSNPSRWKGPRNSVEMLSYSEAKLFCTKITALMQINKLIHPNQVVRLPSEAEWEYVARAGTKTKYSFGDEIADLDAHAWYTGNAAGNDPPVGAKKPNPWGLYDVHGYLWEWCDDSYHETYKDAPTDGRSRITDNATHGVLRGGSWKDAAEKLTSSYRQKAKLQLRDAGVGLRCVLAVRMKQ